MIVLACIEPFWHIRFCRIRNTRLGHLAMNTDALLRRWKIDGKPSRTTFLFITSGGVSANLHLLKKWQELIPVLPEGMLAILIRKFLHLHPKSRFHHDLIITSTEYREFSLGQPSITLTSAERKYGADQLSHSGVPKNRWFVCFANRDPAYLQTQAPQHDWSYHSFRDTSITNCILGMQDVVQRGGIAVRMGAKVAVPLPTLGPDIVDYASCGRTDFLDVYLAENCKFFVGAANGLSQLPLIFDTPYVATNVIPIFQMYFGKRVLFMPKLFKKNGENDFLPFWVLQDLGLFDDKKQVGLDTEWYENHDLMPIENDEIDIRDACCDMFNLLNGMPIDSQDQELQRRYKERYFSKNQDRCYAPDLAPSFARRWLTLI